MPDNLPLFGGGAIDWTPWLLLAGVSAVFLLPFLLFSLVPRFTGRHMLGFAFAMFGVIIAVNVVLAVKAVSTFPGLEVANSYIASQNFDRDRAAQQALGWTVTPDYDGEMLSFTIRDAGGLPARPQSVGVTISRPTTRRDDVTPVLVNEGGVWRAPVVLAQGNWNVDFTAVAQDGTPFRQRYPLHDGDLVGAWAR